MQPNHVSPEQRKSCGDSSEASAPGTASDSLSWRYHAVFPVPILLIIGFWWRYPMMGDLASKWLIFTATVWVWVTATQRLSPELSPANRIIRRAGRWVVWVWLCMIVVLTIVLPCIVGPPTE